MSVRFALLAVVAFTLAACNRSPLEVVVSRCPAVAVVGDMNTLTKFKGEGRSTDDVMYTASIMDVISSCTEEEAVDSRVEFSVGATAGPAFSGREITLPYFVAILKDNSQIVSKEVFEVTLRFDSKGFARSKEVVTQHIPTIAQARRYNYEVLLGFQMDAQDVVFNMER
ncbi:hypothetical protein [Kordiimonas sp.]|uniref:hypothetical protein n=1 Tax=Kordiimonas sp. TaxID=1970157 RepID=UPI003A93043E